MIKCPKCGSEVYHISTQAVNKCSNVECDYVIDFAYQQRLNKVLAKFEMPKAMELQEEDDICVPTYNNRSVHIEYWSLKDDGDVEHFKIGWNDYPRFSLKTIESYINDLELMN